MDARFVKEPKGFIPIPIIAAVAALLAAASVTIFGQVSQEERPLSIISMRPEPSCANDKPVIGLFWNLVDGETGYNIFRSSGGSTETLGPTTFFAYTDFTVTAGTNYNYQIVGATSGIASNLVQVTARSNCQPAQPIATPTPTPPASQTQPTTPPAATPPAGTTNLPDLKVTSVNLSAVSILAGASLTATVTVANVGNAPAQNSILGLYESASLSPICSTAKSGERPIPSIPVSGSPPGTTTIAGFTLIYQFTAPASPGLHNFWALSDANCQISETDDNNNAALAFYNVTPAAGATILAPVQPAGLRVAPGYPACSATAGRARVGLIWDPPAAAQSINQYTVDIGTDPNFASGTFASAYNIGSYNQTSYDNLSTATTYHWRVIAVNSTGPSQPSSGPSFTTPACTQTAATPPPVAASATPTPPAGQVITLTARPGCSPAPRQAIINLFWGPVTGENTYVILRATGAGAVDPQQSISTSTNNTFAFTDFNVSPGVKYNYQIQGETTRVRSNTVSATALTDCQSQGGPVIPVQPTPTPIPPVIPPVGTTDQPPAAFSLTSPANQATAVSNNPDFDWTDAGGAQGYWVYVGQPGAGWLWSKTTTQSQASWNNGSGWQKMEGKNQEPPSSFPDVAAAGDAASWNWFVTAFNSAGKTHATQPADLQLGGPQLFVFTVGQLLPGVFFPISPADNATVSANPCFDWTDASGAVSYRIHLARSTPAEIIQRFSWSKTTSQSQACWDGGSGWLKPNEEAPDPPSSLPDGIWGWTVIARNAAGQSGGFGAPISGQFAIGTGQQPQAAGVQPPAATPPPAGQPPSSTPPLTGNETVSVAGFVGEINSGWALARVLIEVFNGFDDPPTYTYSGADGYYQVSGFRLHPNNNVNPIRVSALTANPQPGGTAGRCFGPAQEFPVYHQSSRWIPVTPGGSYTVDHWFDCGARTGRVGNIEGYVTTDDGRPIVDILVLASPYVTIDRTPVSGGGGLPAYTDANGRYLVQAVNEGQTYVQTSGASSTLGCGFDRGVTVTVVDGQTVTAPTITLEDCQATQPKKIGGGTGILKTIGQAVQNLFGGAKKTTGGGQAQTAYQPPTLVNEYTWCDGGQAKVQFVWYNSPNAISHDLIYKTATEEEKTVTNVISLYTITVPNGLRIESWNIRANFAGGSSILSDNGPWGGWHADTCQPGTEVADQKNPEITSVDLQSDQTIYGDYWIGLQASDNVKVSHVALFVDGVDFEKPHDTDWYPDGGPYNLKLFASQLPAGQHRLVFYAFDEARNGSEPVTIDLETSPQGSLSLQTLTSICPQLNYSWGVPAIGDPYLKIYTDAALTQNVAEIYVRGLQSAIWDGGQAGTIYWAAIFSGQTEQLSNFVSATCRLPQSAAGPTQAVPIRDTSCQVNRQYALARIGSQAEAKLDYVISTAVANGWNPCWIVALWIEESGGTTNIGYLACMGSIEANLGCFLANPFYQNMSSNDYYRFISNWCGPNQAVLCANNPHFLGNVIAIYRSLAS